MAVYRSPTKADLILLTNTLKYTDILYITFYYLTYNNMFEINKADTTFVSSRISEVSARKKLSTDIVNKFTAMEPEEKAGQLRSFITNDLKLTVAECKSWWELFTGNWVMWYNVIHDWMKLWTVRVFDRDANVVFSQFWKKWNVNIWKLTPTGVVQIKRTMAA